jgi:hypothetical protein
MTFSGMMDVPESQFATCRSPKQNFDRYECPPKSFIMNPTVIPTASERAGFVSNGEGRLLERHDI